MIGQVVVFLQELGKVLGTSLIAGLFAAFVAAIDFRYRKWWELRLAAYQGVIGASPILFMHGKYITKAAWA